MLEERFDNVPTKEFYCGLLKEMEKTPLKLEGFNLSIKILLITLNRRWSDPQSLEKSFKR